MNRPLSAARQLAGAAALSLLDVLHRVAKARNLRRQRREAHLA